MILYVFNDNKLVRHAPFEPVVTVDAVSGPWGKGAAPKGVYQVDKPIWLDKTATNAPYTDKEGNAWFARMHPLFKTSRSGFGLHPDGNVPGTRGCIGLTVPRTAPFASLLTLDIEDDGAVYLLVT